MASIPGYVIRDGVESDVVPCLNLASDYETEFVWQVHIQQDPALRSATFKTERLPRVMRAQYPASASRLQNAYEDAQCFLVAASRDEPGTLLGYLTMRQDTAHQIGWIHDLVVDESVRRRRIGTRLLKVARQWAQEHALRQVMIETQTKNYPAIQFCQNAGFVFCGYNDRYFMNQDIAVFFVQSVR